MNRRPRVTAHDHVDAITTDQLCGIGSTTPKVDLLVEFDLHDHEGALIALEGVVARVRAQIEDVTPADAERSRGRCPGCGWPAGHPEPAPDRSWVTTESVRETPSLHRPDEEPTVR